MWLCRRGFVQVGPHAVFRRSQIRPRWLDEEWTALASPSLLALVAGLNLILLPLIGWTCLWHGLLHDPTSPSLLQLSPFPAALLCLFSFRLLPHYAFFFPFTPLMYILFLCLSQLTYFPHCHAATSATSILLLLWKSFFFFFLASICVFLL